MSKYKKIEGEELEELIRDPEKFLGKKLELEGTLIIEKLPYLDVCDRGNLLLLSYLEDDKDLERRAVVHGDPRGVLGPFDLCIRGLISPRDLSIYYWAALGASNKKKIKVRGELMKEEGKRLDKTLRDHPEVNYTLFFGVEEMDLPYKIMTSKVDIEAYDKKQGEE